MLTRACLLLFVLWQVSPPDPADVAAARAAEAHRAGRTEELRTLAGAAEPDPWLVVEALVAGGNRDAARAFAALVPTGPDTGSLVAYAAAPGSPADEQARVLATQVVPNLREARHEDVLAMLGEPPAESTCVTAIRLAHLRAAALRGVNRFAESAEALMAAADGAERIGWLGMSVVCLSDAAMSLREGGEFARATETLERLARLQEGRQHWRGLREALSRLHEVRQAAGDPDGALAALRRLREACEKAGDPVGVVEAASAMSRLHLSAGRFDEAAAALHEAVAVAEAAGEEGLLGRLLEQEAALAVQRGRPDEAFAIEERNAAQSEKRGDTRGLTRALMRQAALQERLHHPERALALRERAVDVARAENSTPDLAVAVAELGGLCARLGDDARALALSLRAQRLFEQSGQTNIMAREIWNTGRILRRLGDEARAAKVLERAWTQCEEFQDMMAVSPINASRAEALMRLGRIAGALQTMAFAVGGFEARSDRTGHASGLARFGRLQVEAGDDPAAVDSLTKALNLREEMRFAEGVADPALDLADLHVRAGRDEEAVAVLRKALALAEAGHARFDQAVIRNWLAIERPEGALENAEAARRLAAEAGNPTLETAALSTLAGVRARAGDEEVALQSYGEALARATRWGDLLGEVLARSGLAALHLERGRHREALEAARPGLAALRHLRGASGADLPSWWEPLSGDFLLAGLRAAAALGDAEAAAEVLLTARWQGSVDRFGGGRRISAALLPEAALSQVWRARAEEAVAESFLAAAIRAGAGDAEGASRERLEAARRSLAGALAAVAPKAGPGAFLLDPSSATPAALRGRLRADEALVLAYARRETLVAVVITPEDRRLVPLDAPAELRAALTSYDPSPEAAEVAGRLVRDRLALPPGAKRVFVSLYGDLLLRIPPALLFPDREVVLLPVAAALSHRDALPPATGEGVLAFGDPEYVAAGQSAFHDRLAGGRLTPLPETREEASAAGDEVRLGPQATELELPLALGGKPRWRALHLGGHLVPNEAQGGLAYLALAPDGTNDGLLTALEILHQKVPADLVVLPVLRAEAEDVAPVGGLLQLAAAFAAAGAPRLLVPHWAVAPEARRAFLAEFYARGKAGASASAALRGAQEALKSGEAFRAPRHWAGWTLWGLPE